MEVTSQRIDTNWFRSRLADRRLSQRQLAKLLDLDPAAVSLMLRGKRKMSAAEASEIAVQLGVSVQEVLVRAGSTPTVPSKNGPEIRRARVEGGEGGWQAKGSKAPEKAIEAVVAAPPDGSMVELPVPMADGSTARLVLPRNMGKDDAQRIAAVVQALALPN